MPPAPGPAVVPATPHTPTRKKLWVIALVAAVGIGAAYYYQASQAAATGSAIMAVPTVTASLGDVEATIRVSGTITARNQASILAPRIQGSRTGANRGGSGQQAAQGRGNAGGGGGGQQGGGGGGGGGGFGAAMGGDFSLILIKLADPGTRVKSGEVIAEFDPQFQQQRLDDYKDTLIQMDSSIRGLVATLAASAESHDQQVRAAKADFERASLDVTTKEVRSAIDAEKFQLTMEENDAVYKQLVYEDTLVDEQQRSTIRSTQLNRDQADIELKRAENNVARMTVRAPIDGVVVMASIVRNGEFGQVRNGDQVQPGQPFMYIVDPTSMVLAASVNQVDAEKLRLGMKARVRLDAYNDIELPGTLEGIGALSKSSTFRAGYVGQIPVQVRLDKMDARIIPDLTGSAEIAMGLEKDVLTVPREALFEENGNSFVFVRGQKGWVRKPVEIGLPNFTKVAIRSGLQKGDVVAAQRPI